MITETNNDFDLDFDQWQSIEGERSQGHRVETDTDEYEDDPYAGVYYSDDGF